MTSALPIPAAALSKVLLLCFGRKPNNLQSWGWCGGSQSADRCTGHGTRAMAGNDAGKLGVFIFNSRDDLKFVDQLDADFGLHFTTTNPKFPFENGRMCAVTAGGM